MNLSNYYEILNLPNNSTLQELKNQYRKLSFNLHPDRNKNPLDNEKYKKITEAYKIIYDYKIQNNSNQENLNISNSQLAIQPQYIDENSLNHFANLLLNKFNSSSNIITNEKPSPIFHEIEIDIFQAYTGINYPLKINRYIYENFIKREQSETIYISIPKGIDNNEILYIKEKGNRNSIELIGDIEVKVIINNNSEFERKGLDLFLKKNISLKDALCGFDFDVKHLNGKTYKFSNKQGSISSTNFKKTISNLGLMRENSIGNLYLTFNVALPENLTLKQINLLKQIL